MQRVNAVAVSKQFSPHRSQLPSIAGNQSATPFKQRTISNLIAAQPPLGIDLIFLRQRGFQ